MQRLSIKSNKQESGLMFFLFQDKIYSKIIRIFKKC
uniref:Uncharacterized protein n=1 Tax=Anguilla anguilla TaxID=7936 RepID=A0A0E9SFN3_ANGAN